MSKRHVCYACVFLHSHTRTHTGAAYQTRLDLGHPQDHPPFLPLLRSRHDRESSHNMATDAGRFLGRAVAHCQSKAGR